MSAPRSSATPEQSHAMRVEGPPQRWTVLSPKRSSDVLQQLRRILIPCVCLLSVLTGCDRVVSQIDVTSATITTVTKSHPSKRKPSHCGPQCRHWITHLALQQWLDGVWTFTHTPVDWYAIADCETGGNWNVVGSEYSTGLGMMNEAIRENSPADVAARELNGTASVLDMVGTARRIASWAGIHAWGCGKKLYP